MSMANPIVRPSQMRRPIVCKPLDKGWKKDLKINGGAQTLSAHRPIKMKRRR